MIHQNGYKCLDSNHFGYYTYIKVTKTVIKFKKWEWLILNDKQRTMLEGMDMLMQKISKNLDSKTFTVLELIEMSNDVYFEIMKNYCDDSKC